MISGQIVAAIAAIAVCIPSGIVAFAFWLIERRITRRQDAEKKERAARQEEVDRRDEARKENEIVLIKCVSASLTLGEATARAVERIPDANCNGEMHSALEYAESVEHERDEFLTRQGIEHLFEGGRKK